jgi:predicted XRE-type DNA-binding protein
MVTNVRETAKEKVNSASSVLVHTYLSSRQSYLVSAIEEQPAVAAKDSPDQVPSLLPEAVARTTTSLLRSLPSMGISSLSQHATTLVEVLASDLEAAPAAKFYPVLETLMRRADETATVARQLWSDEANRATQDVVNKTGRALQQASVPAPGPLETTDVEPTVEAAKGKLHALADQVEEATPAVEEQFRQILGMVKDEEITTLLENCKSRLEQLVTKDLSKATQDALAASGIRIQLEEHAETVAAEGATAGTAVVPSMQQSREAALQSIERILKQADVETSDLEAVRGELTQNFTAAFDALSTAARSDRSLNTLFDSIAEKTTVWQEASGRLLQTRSANLFMEGATRLQARAAAILSIHQRTGSEISSKMTKAFTEGDAAIARIKSIQLGDSLKDRLVKAIEVRSDSLGGLDAIIAGALTTVRSQDADANQIKDMLSSLQSSASTATTDARETLISILSRHNAYRDVALVKMESVLCDLESQFGSDFSPQDIAAVARGEGGTAKLFEPIARRAWQQIEKQLDEAESQVSDTNVLQGLSRVRKIMSGELTLAALTDEFVSVLNDENVVAAGQVFVQKGEEVLDALEGVSSNTVVSDALKIAEKVGITKDSVMREINKLDVDQLLDTAGDAVTDEGKRRQLVSNAIDTALDFILRILPSMPVPPFDGVRDGLLYNISNLSMQGFKVRKEDITIELAGMRASKRSKNSTSSDGVEEDGSKSGEDQDDTMEIEEVDGAVKATELLIIDVRSISAVLEDTEWSFEQTYMPYLKGQGKSDVRLSNGAIRLQFELRRRRKIVESSTTGDDVLWEPVLCLHDRSCTIGEIELKMQGEGKLTWLFNKAASIFKGPLRDYVVRTIIKILTNQSGWLLGKLNSVLQPYWDLVLKTAKLDLVSRFCRVLHKPFQRLL